MTNNPPIRVLFLLQRPEAWFNLASLWDFLWENEAFEPELWVLPYHAENMRLSKTKTPLIKKILTEKSVPFHEWVDGESIPKNCFDIALLNHPYDRERPRLFWADRIKSVIPNIIYIPYGLIMGGGYKNMKLQFAQTTQVHASAIIARSRFEKDLYAKYCPKGCEHVYILGQPRFDQVLKKLAEPVPQPMIEATAGRLTVLWNSHFSFGITYSQSSNFSTFDLLGPEIFELALARQEDLCLLWRPHPGLFPAIVREGLLSESDIPTLRSELINVGIVLDESPEHIPSFKVSDALLTDIGSFLLEYLVTGKPVLALINPEGEPLNEESSKLVQHYISASKPQDITHFINRLELGDIKLSALKVAQTQHLPMLDGHAAERVARLIIALHNGELNSPDLQDKLNASPLPSHLGESGFASVIKKKKTTVKKTSSEMPPTLARLVRGLRELRKKKAQEPSWRKKARRDINKVRTFLVEKVKRLPALMYLAQHLKLKLNEKK